MVCGRGWWPAAPGRPESAGRCRPDGAAVRARARPGAVADRDDEVAAALAADVLGLVAIRRAPWTLRPAGLPMGDPTLRALGRLRPDAAFATARSSRLVDRMAGLGPVRRSRDPREVQR